MRLKNKVAVITGAAQGIGAAYAVGFAKEGAKIVIADILDGANAVKKVEAQGSEAIFIRTDVSKEEQCLAMAKAGFDRFGAIDILINNAATFGDIVLRPFTQITSEEFKRVLEINVGGCFHCIKAVFPYMKERGERSSTSPQPPSWKASPACPNMSPPKARSWP